MTDTVKLNELINNAGISKTYLAEKLGCSRNRIYSILKGADITASEIYKLTEILHISKKDSQAIFFKEPCG